MVQVGEESSADQLRPAVLPDIVCQARPQLNGKRRRQLLKLDSLQDLRYTESLLSYAVWSRVGSQDFTYLSFFFLARILKAHSVWVFPIPKPAIVPNKNTSTISHIIPIWSAT